MKHNHFYSHLVITDRIEVELDTLYLSAKEKKELQELLHSSIHHTVYDTVLSELSESDKRIFLNHALHSDHATIWYFLKRKTNNIESKILQAVVQILDNFHKDIKSVKK